MCDLPSFSICRRAVGWHIEWWRARLLYHSDFSTFSDNLFFCIKNLNYWNDQHQIQVEQYIILNVFISILSIKLTITHSTEESNRTVLYCFNVSISVEKFWGAVITRKSHGLDCNTLDFIQSIDELITQKQIW